MGMYDYNKRNWEDEVTNAQERKRAAEAALSGLGSFNYTRQGEYDAARDAVLNRDKFKYDLNKDALYKQAAENYKNLGKIAMQDTIGQASAMTGGYGNSYAVTAGQQAFNQFMQKSNDMIPQFYQMARENYDAEGNDLRAKLGILADDRNTAYSEWQNDYSRLASDRDYAGNQYNNVYNAAYEAARAQEQMDYQKQRDAVADSQWERQFAASQRRSSGSLGSSSGGRSGSSSGGKKLSDSEMRTLKTKALEAFMKNGNDGENGLNDVLKLYGFDSVADADIIDEIVDYVYEMADKRIKDPVSRTMFEHMTK